LGTLSLSPERQSAEKSKITHDGLTLSGTGVDWIEQCFTSLQHSIGYMGDGFTGQKQWASKS